MLKATNFQQTGLAIITLNRLPAAWKKYLNNEMTEAEVVQHLAKAEEAESDISYGNN